MSTGSGQFPRIEALDARRRSRGPDCVSTLSLDQLALGELPGPARAALLAHLERCADCARANAALTEDRTRFLADVAVPTLAAQAMADAARAPAPMWSRLRRFLLPVGALGAAAAAALAIFVGGPGDGTRTKGDFALSPYVLHAEANGAGKLHAGEPLHPGDRLQFRYNGAEAGYLAVVAIDAGGEVSVYYPPGATTEAVGAGRDVALSSAVELDDTLGREVIVGVRCSSPIPVATVVAAAHREAQAARARGQAPTELGPLGLSCVETRHRIEKQPRPTP